MKGFKLWDPKANKVVISRDVVFDEKSMLQSTQEKEKQVSENYSGNEQVVQVELESHVDEDSVQKTGSSSSREIGRAHV